ncbi:uncharacterized protein LOC142591252 [Dermacentor variabilis]|uniref:uncharacterized protein LOC142591252 n=1 Tax=Dermacentor variabilis TaxID=34621 RepID=UPI003F5C52D7
MSISIYRAVFFLAIASAVMVLQSLCSSKGQSKKLVLTVVGTAVCPPLYLYTEEGQASVGCTFLCDDGTTPNVNRPGGLCADMNITTYLSLHNDTVYHCRLGSCNGGGPNCTSLQNHTVECWI